MKINGNKMKQEDQQEDYFMPAAKIQLAWMYDISE